MPPKAKRGKKSERSAVGKDGCRGLKDLKRERNAEHYGILTQEQRDVRLERQRSARHGLNLTTQWGPEWALMVPPQYAQVPPGRSNVLFLDARGGCGKTYVLNALLAAARMHKVVGLAGCFTGIAADDYEGGMTLHRLCKLPVMDSFTDAVQSNCNKESQHAELLMMCGIFIIDEAMTAGLKNVMAIQELLQDLTVQLQDVNEVNVEGPTPWFGGRLCIFSGEFSQAAPVTPGADRAQAWRHESRMPLSGSALQQARRCLTCVQCSVLKCTSDAG